MHAMSATVALFCFLSLFLLISCQHATPPSPAAVPQHPSYKYWINSNIMTRPVPDPIKSALSSWSGSGGLFTNLADQVVEPNAKTYINNYVNGTTRNSTSKETMSQFFLKDTIISAGRGTVQLGFIEGLKSKFIPRDMESKYPFNYTSLPQILNMTSVDPKSHIAGQISRTLMECHSKPLKGERVKCVRSLEEMIDTVSSWIGAHQVGWNNATGGDHMGMKTFNYTVLDQFGAAGKPIIACHKMPYPYAVYYCHTDGTTIAYSVILSTSYENNNIILHTIALCHLNTENWDPNHIAFKVLNVQPGGEPICHFANIDTLVFA